MINSLQLVNFKNFANEKLRVGPFTVIVRANASGKSNIRDAFRDPRLGGIGEALKAERIAEIVNRYEAMTDVFILCNAEIIHRELADAWALYDNWRCASSRSRTLARFAPRAVHRLVYEGKMSDVHGASVGLQPAEQLTSCSPSTASSYTLALLVFEAPGPRADRTRLLEPAT